MRRFIGVIRYDEGHIKKESELKKLYKDIQAYIKKYKNESQTSIAAKLQTKYPNYTIGTISVYISDFIHWGIKRNEKRYN